VAKTPYCHTKTVKRDQKMAGFAWLRSRPVGKCGQVASLIRAVGIICLLFLNGCRQEWQESDGGGAVPRKKAAKWFLVTQRDNDFSSIDVYAIEDPIAVAKVGRWIKGHVDSSGRVQRARALMMVWQDELLRFDEHGEYFFSDLVWDKNVMSPGDLVVLKELFQKYGKRVDTVPGRKPPKRRANPREQPRIERAES
jgi:hypothetical protein